MPWGQSRWSSGSWCHRPTCGGGSRRACGPAPRAPSSCRAAWQRRAPSSSAVTCAGTGEHHARRLVERGADHAVADLADRSGHVDLAGLVLSWRQAKRRTDIARAREGGRIIHAALEGDRNDRADARHAHQPAADRISTNDPEQRTMEPRELLLQGGASREHRADHGLEHRMTIDQLEDARLEAPTADCADLESEPAQHPADAALEVEQLALHQLAGS